MSNLQRFIEAQERDYERALNEIKNGQKRSCWMWYIFPQIKGLGMTQTSQYYGIDNIEEAIAYLNNDILKSRLIEITNALLELEDVDIKEVMGFPDNLKLKSSMTLFKKAEELSEIKYDNIFQKVLDKFYEGEDDSKTLLILEKQNFEKERNKRGEKKDEIGKNDERDSTNDKLNSENNLDKNIKIINKQEEKGEDCIKKGKSTILKNEEELEENNIEKVEKEKKGCCSSCIYI